MGRLIALTASKLNGQAYAKPRVVYVNEEFLRVIPPSKTTSLTRVIESQSGEVNTFQVYEEAEQVEAARNPLTTDLYVKKYIEAALAGAGTNQGAGTVIKPTTYIAEALTIGAAATEAFVLPAAVVGRVVVVLSNDASDDAAKVFPAAGEFIDNQLVNTVLSIPAGTRKHFVCPTTAGRWVTAEDFGG